MKVHEQLVALVPTFRRDVSLAQTLESPNAEDDLAIKVAMIGFSYNAPTGEWSHEHYRFLRERLESAYSLRELQGWATEPGVLQLFASLSLGFLLGLYQRNKITDEEFRSHEAQIGGLMALHDGDLVRESSE